MNGTKQLIVNAFANEITYLQGDFCPDDYQARSRRWMSLHTVVGLLAWEFGLNREELHNACGFNNIKLQSYNR